MEATDTMTSNLTGLRVAVTGGTSGLGLALVRELHGAGAAVAFVARTREHVRAVATSFDPPGSPGGPDRPERPDQPDRSRPLGPPVHGIVGDVSNKEDIHSIVLQILGNLGGLDVLINNASSLGPVPLALLGDTECEDLETAIATNLLGPFRLTKTLLGALAASAREGRGGVVLNVSSDAAVTPYPLWGAYGSSKAALDHMSRIWDEELSGTGVRILSIDPGDMDTPLHAVAVPDADPSTLKSPHTAARELAEAISRALPRTDLQARTPAAAGVEARRS
jgi:NAD(P)-dependent dehydrogenase (short-subunit alcohol dehydrogenase family)